MGKATRVSEVYDSENDQTLILMTNNFTWGRTSFLSYNWF